MTGISFIITIQQEIFSLEDFFQWLQEALLEKGFLRRTQRVQIPYEVIVLSNNPQHPTINELQETARFFPFKLFIDQQQTQAGLSTKGFSLATYDTIISGDVHKMLTPDILLKTIKKLQDTTQLLILTNKTTGNITQESMQLLTDPVLLAVQKKHEPAIFLFKKAVWKTISFIPKHDKTFCIEFLYRAQEAGFGVKEYEILSLQEEYKKTLLTTMSESLRARFAVFLLKQKKVHPQYIAPDEKDSMLNAGFGYKRKQYVTHTVLDHTNSAIESFASRQLLFFFFFFFTLAFFLILFPVFILQLLIACLSVIYLIDVLFNVYLVLKTLRTSYEITYTADELTTLNEDTLPMYSVLCPLYKEAHVIPQFIEGIEKLDYPKEKLDVLLLLEEDDSASIQAIPGLQLPSYVRTIIVPHSLPKTKPKACNYGLSYVKGEYVVIYDAEDMPDPLQLKKAFIGFNKSSEKIVCLQAKLNYYNTYQNLLTRFFAAEYSLWFDVTLTGLQALNTTIPLGGTSNHFKTKDIKRLKAWDPFNVTEDADLGVRLFKEGYQTAVIDSVTLEEANSKVGNWIRQRSRWIKGYMQTYLVHTREIIPFIQKRGRHAFIFHLVIGGKLAFIFINPLLWVVTLTYFIFHTQFAGFIDTLYPPVILYIAIITFIFGNYFYFFCYVLGCVKKEQWGLIKYVYFIPLYWLLISIAGFMGFYQLLFKPHYWEKTIHGLHLQKNKKQQKTFFGLPKFAFATT